MVDQKLPLLDSVNEKSQHNNYILKKEREEHDES
jgi:hypothetical protein